MDGGEGRSAEGGLNPPLGLFELAMGPRSANILRGLKSRLTTIGKQIHAFHVVPSWVLLSQS